MSRHAVYRLVLMTGIPAGPRQRPSQGGWGRGSGAVESVGLSGYRDCARRTWPDRLPGMIGRADQGTRIG